MSRYDFVYLECLFAAQEDYVASWRQKTQKEQLGLFKLVPMQTLRQKV